MTSASKRVREENHLRRDSLYQFIIRGRLILPAAWLGHRHLNLFPHQAFLLRRMARHLARLKTRTIRWTFLKGQWTSCTIEQTGLYSYVCNDHMTWLGERFSRMKPTAWSECFFGGINKHVSVIRRKKKILYWMLHLQLIPYYA